MCAVSVRNGQGNEEVGPEVCLIVMDCCLTRKKLKFTNSFFSYKVFLKTMDLRDTFRSI